MARLLAALVAVMALGGVSGGVDDTRTLVAARFTQLTRASMWTQVSATRVSFDTHHPQGLVKIGDTLIVSSVEVTRPTKRFPQPIDGLDRDAGAGVGHLFRMTLDGRLLAHALVGDGAIYHPGGLDYDGAHLWVAVAEYRPNSRSIVYRVDPETLKAVEVLRVADHLGASVHDTDAHALYGVSWGSRRFYRWTLDAQGAVTNAGAPLDSIRTLNPSHYVDYQDCKYAGARRMLCSGVADVRAPTGAVALGGLDLVSLDEGRPVHQVPLLLWTPAGVSLARNPVFLEPTKTGLRGYFMPEDNASTLYVYDVQAP